ncbi:MAG: response regulator [Nitrospirae bacterium]|nr:response regulator [Nitrospirota bacterium]
MGTAVFLETGDYNFAQTLTKTLLNWGLSVFHHNTEQDAVVLMEQEQIGVALLDIRISPDASLTLLKHIRENRPGAEIILINSHDNIRVSMDAMQAGANDEIIVPCDTGILKKKIAEALKRRKKLLHKKRGLSFLEMFSESMSAAAFAQAGEFDTAIDYMNDAGKYCPEQTADKKKSVRKPY